MEVRDFPGARDDPDDEASLFNLSDSEADPIDCDRAFRNYVMSELGWKRYLDSPVPADRFDGQDFAGSVDVSLNDMPIETAGDWKWALEIHQVARFQETKIRAPKRLSQKIERDRGPCLAGNG